MFIFARTWKCLGVLGVIALVFLAGSPAFPQGNTGRILGVVTDQSGGYVVGANITIMDVQRGTTRNLVTDSSGSYLAVGLLPGTYTLRTEAKGFKLFERQNLLLETGKDLNVDVVLQTGSSNEVVTITAEAPLVDTTTTTLGGTLSNEIINDLPLNGRNYQNLLTLRPGVEVYPGGGPWTQSTNGGRPESVGYLVDGLPNDEAFMGLSITNAAAVIGDAATILPVDAIQEFNTQVNPKAEFGWKTGAVTSVGLKSGTNEIHGSAYAYGRSDSFDARNFFNPTSQPKVPVSLEQFGGTAGGHIVKDKLFWFGGYEEQRYTVGSNLLITVPTTQTLGGNPANSIPDAINAILADPTQRANLNAASLSLLGCPANGPYTSGTCTAALFGANNTQGTNIDPTYTNTNESRNGLGKVDYHINDRHSISGSYFLGNDNLVGEDTPYTNAAFLTHVHSRAQAASGHWTWTPSAQWANEFRFGYTRYYLSITPGDQSKPAAGYGLNTGVTNPIIGGLPSITVGSFTAMGNFFSFPKFVGPDNTYDIVDQVTYNVGKHALKFGGQFRDIKVDQATWRRARGDIRFKGPVTTVGGNPSTGLEDFLLGNITQLRLLATSSDPVLGSPERHMTQYGFAAFLQDDWRVRQRITLNLGVRYEYSTPPSEANDLLGNFDPNSPTGMVQVGKGISSMYNPDHTDFAPRVGVAWDVTGKGTTIVRSGFGISYELLTMNTFLSQQNTNNAPTLGLGVIPTGAEVMNGSTVVAPAGSMGNIVTTGIVINPPPSLPWPGTASNPVFPANSSSQVVCSTANPCSILGMDRNYKTPYVMSWSFGLQHAFSSHLSLDANYVGNHGDRLTGIRDVNQPVVGTTGAAPGPGAYFSQFPWLGYINVMSNLFRSNYNGLQLTLTGRNYHGFSFVAGYTYSHALDNMSFNWNQYLPQDSLHPGADYGNSDFDITHRFTLSLTYDIPGIKTWGQLLEGWQLNSIITLQSGQPWNVIDYNATYGFSNSGEGTDRWDFFGNPKNFKSGGPNSIIACSDPVASDPTQASCFQNFNAGAQTVNFSQAQSAAYWTACSSKAPDQGTLQTAGCYVSKNGKSVMVPNAMNTFGTMGRNIFRDTGFRNVDFSIAKSWKFKERLNMQFKAEMFNLFNHPNFANPWGGTSGYGPAGGFSDPTVPGNFGCGCATPDVAAVNPVLGSGGARAIQLGLKFTF